VTNAFAQQSCNGRYALQSPAAPSDRHPVLIEDGPQNNREENAMRVSFRKIAVPSLAVLSVTAAISAIPGTSYAADPAYCAQYAQLAVHEAQVLSTLSCFRGFDGRWHLNYAKHYGWCLTADPGAVAAERDYRRMRIAQCGG